MTEAVINPARNVRAVRDMGQARFRDRAAERALRTAIERKKLTESLLATEGMKPEFPLAEALALVA